MAISVINLASLDGKNGFRVDGGGRERAGYSVSGAGDVNGDGFDDVVVGAYSSSYSGSYMGTSFVVLGKAAGFAASMNLSDLDGTNGFRLDGIGAHDFSGSSVSRAGDVNSDGFDDVVIGAGRSTLIGDTSGSGYVVFGRASEFDASMNLSELNGSNGFRLDGDNAHEHFGFSVSNVGDVNGDGFGDVIIGVPGTGAGGSSYVVFGRASGFDASMNLTSLDGRNGFRLDGGGLGADSGWSVSAAGDVNGDGFADVLIGAPGADLNGKVNSGSSYVVFGQASGFSAVMNLSSLNGVNGFRLDGEHAGDFSGTSVSSAGDINGDGFDDVIIGSPNAELSGIRPGSSYVVFGKAAGFDASMSLSNLDGHNGFRLQGTADLEHVGGSVSDAGDVNGDGYDDLIISAPQNGTSVYGLFYMVLGRASGFGTVVDLSNSGIDNVIQINGGFRANYLGWSVSGAGDVNGDGFDDVIVGTPEHNENGRYSGSSYVIFGSRDFGSGGELPEIRGTEGDDTLKGSAGAEHFIAGEGNDSLLGRGGADIFDGGAGNDAIRIGDLTFASIDGGEGNDVLHLAGKDLNLDLKVLGNAIHDIETICLYGRGDNTLTLTAETLLALSNSTDTLKVHGNSGDHVVVKDSGWVDGGSRGFYHTYTHDDAVLLVGANVMVEFV